MARRKKREKPLLYIHQPEYPELSTSMQEKYHFNDRVNNNEIENTPVEEQNKQESSVAVELEKVEEQDISNVLEESVTSKDVEESVTSKDVKESVTSKEVEESKKKRPFNELSIIEKIEYLEQFPVSIVKIQYSFVTVEEKIVGYFVSNEEDQIRVIPKGKRKPVLIPVEEILDIKVRGL